MVFKPSSFKVVHNMSSYELKYTYTHFYQPKYFKDLKGLKYLLFVNWLLQKLSIYTNKTYWFKRKQDQINQ